MESQRLYIGMIERGQPQHASLDRLGVTLCGIPFDGYYAYKSVITCPECSAKATTPQVQ